MLFLVLLFELIFSEADELGKSSKSNSDYVEQIFNLIIENEILRVFAFITFMICFIIFFFFLMKACSGLFKILLEIVGAHIAIYIGVQLGKYLSAMFLN